jgi:hypothetical protein
MESLLHVDVMEAWQPWTGFSTNDITDGTIATVLGVLGLFLIFSAFGHLLIMLTRAASLLVLTATTPIAGAGLVWEGGRAWFWKSFRWFHAAAFTPVVMMLMLGLGVQVTSKVGAGYTDTLQKAVGTAVPGVMLILVGCFAPLALFKLLAFVDPGTSSGAAMRAGLAAQGGLQGLLSGRGQSDSTSDAASRSDAGGRSQGEASTEDATSSRFTSVAGGFMSAVGPAGQIAAAGVGVAAGLGSRAAALGADLTNQMGVGHNSYIPDFSNSRSRKNISGPSDHDNPDVNGAADALEQSSPSTQGPPETPAPPWPRPPASPAAGEGSAPGSSPTSRPGGSPGAGGGGAAGGAGAGGAGAGAVPVVPV